MLPAVRSPIPWYTENYHVLTTITHVELDIGQLVKDPYFTLFESVGALEVSKRLYLQLFCADIGP